MNSTATDGQQAGQPLGLGLSEGLGPLLEGWANVEGVRFVNRSSGQYTTATVSREGLWDLMRAVQAAERARWTEAVMAELDGNGQAHAIVAYATRA